MDRAMQVEPDRLETIDARGREVRGPLRRKDRPRSWRHFLGPAHGLTPSTRKGSAYAARAAASPAAARWLRPCAGHFENLLVGNRTNLCVLWPRSDKRRMSAAGETCCSTSHAGTAGWVPKLSHPPAMWTDGSFRDRPDGL